MVRAPALVAALLAVVPAAHRAEGGPDAPDLGALAQAILRGADDVAAEAALRAKALSPDATQRLLREIAAQARVYRALDAKQIRGLAWENVGLADALTQVRTIAGFAAGATPRVAAEHAEVRYTLHVDASNAATLLDLMTEPFDLAWGVRDGGVRVFAKQEVSFVDAPAPPTVGVRIDEIRVTLVKEGPLTEIVAALRTAAGVDLMLDPRVTAELSTRRVSVQLEDTPLREALDALVAQLGKGVAWTVQGSAVVITASVLVPR